MMMDLPAMDVTSFFHPDYPSFTGPGNVASSWALAVDSGCQSYQAPAGGDGGQLHQPHGSINSSGGHGGHHQQQFQCYAARNSAVFTPDIRSKFDGVAGFVDLDPVWGGPQPPLTGDLPAGGFGDDDGQKQLAPSDSLCNLSGSSAPSMQSFQLFQQVDQQKTFDSPVPNTNCSSPCSRLSPQAEAMMPQAPLCSQRPGGMMPASQPSLDATYGASLHTPYPHDRHDWNGCPAVSGSMDFQWKPSDNFMLAMEQQPCRPADHNYHRDHHDYPQQFSHDLNAAFNLLVPLQPQQTGHWLHPQPEDEPMSSVSSQQHPDSIHPTLERLKRNHDSSLAWSCADFNTGTRNSKQQKVLPAGQQIRDQTPQLCLDTIPGCLSLAESPAAPMICGSMPYALGSSNSMWTHLNTSPLDDFGNQTCAAPASSSTSLQYGSTCGTPPGAWQSGEELQQSNVPGLSSPPHHAWRQPDETYTYIAQDNPALDPDAPIQLQQSGGEWDHMLHHEVTLSNPETQDPRTPQEGDAGQTQTDKKELGVIFSARTKEELLEVLRPHFSIKMDMAAKQLGCCLTALKKKCRELDISRWPKRKFDSNLRHIHDIEAHEDTNKLLRRFRATRGCRKGMTAGEHKRITLLYSLYQSRYNLVFEDVPPEWQWPEEFCSCCH